MPTPWQEYLNVPEAERLYDECYQRCKGSFQTQRENISRLITQLQPKSVACLGAGILNDIPYDVIVKSGAEIHLVDWLPGAIESGIRKNIIDQDDQGSARCVYCTSKIPCPTNYCRNFHKPDPSPRGVCDNFKPLSESPVQCASFERASHPIVHEADATGGYASAFAEGIGEECKKINSWKQVLLKAIKLSEKAKRNTKHLSIKDGSVHFVTSSMLISQFEHEPYGFLSKCAADVIGPPSSREEQSLHSSLDILRSALLLNQVEEHCREIRRILTPDGRVYMSFEFFHYDETNRQWFLVESVSKALEIVGRFFNFDFDKISEEVALSQFQTGREPSLVFSFLLAPK